LHQPGRKRAPSPAKLRQAAATPAKGSCPPSELLSAPLNHRNKDHRHRTIPCSTLRGAEVRRALVPDLFVPESRVLLSPVPLPDPDNRSLFVAGIFGRNSTY
jgi:hypothetical protein